METKTPSLPKQVRIQLAAQASGPAPRRAGVALHGERAGWSDLLEQCVREVFELMLNATLERGEGAPAEEGFELCAMVGLAGNLCGVLSLRSSNHCGARIASCMLGTEVSEYETSVLDAFGEVCNMVAGSFKARIPETADGCMLSVPTVINGKDYTVRALAAGERIQAHLKFENNPLFVTLGLQS